MGFLRKNILGYKFMRLASKIDNVMIDGTEEEYDQALDKYRNFVYGNDLNLDESRLCEVVRREFFGYKSALKQCPANTIEINFRNIEKLPLQLLGGVKIKGFSEFRNKTVLFHYSPKSGRVQTSIKNTSA